MTYYDVSIPLQNGLPVWPGDDPPQFGTYAQISAGDPVNCTRLACSAHTGTHVDAPRHLFNDGGAVDALELSRLIGPARVLALEGQRLLDRRALQNCDFGGCRRVLFKTDNSRLWKEPAHVFEPDFVSLTADGAQFLVEQSVDLVGIDYLSIDCFDNAALDAHKILLRRGIIVIENVNLLEVPAGDYELICLPLRLAGADGAPARVVLRDG